MSDPKRRQPSEEPKKIHPNALAAGLVRRAAELIRSKPAHTSVFVELPDKAIVSTGNVEDVVRRMTAIASNHGLRVLHYTNGGQIWLQRA